ncbi:MAG: hypothetical protein ACH37Z_02275 [Anaerolineae bacterium]
MHELTEAQRQAILGLSHFDPSCEDDYGNQALDYLVLNATAAFGPLLLVEALQVKHHIKQTFRLEFEEAEINKAAFRLGQRNMLSYTSSEDRFGSPRFQILGDVHDRVSTNLQGIRKLEEEVYSEWVSVLESKYSDHSEVLAQLDQVVEVFKRYLSRLLQRHGIECVGLLYPENAKARQWLVDVQGEILDGLLPSEGFVDAIARIEFPQFFKDAQDQRRSYLQGIFNSSFYWHLIQVDEGCSRLIRSVTRGQRLYLDTNILYSLVGFDGENVMTSVHRMLDLARQLEYELIVTTKTLDEFHESIRRRMRELKSHPPISVDLARVAVERLGSNGFLPSYWSDFIRRGLSVEEFVAERTHVEGVLSVLGVEVSNKHRAEIENSQELADEEGILNSVVSGLVSRNVIEHDAFHRVLITKVRRKKRYAFNDAAAWFLTHDTKLPHYDKVARKGGTHLPFCLTGNQWVQVNRPLLARVSSQEDNEASYFALVTQPYVRAMVSSKPLDRLYNSILGRLTQYQGMTYQIAMEITANRAFMAAVADESDPIRIDALVDEGIADLANELLNEKEELRGRAERRQGEYDELSIAMSTLQLRLDRSDADMQRLQEIRDSEFDRIEQIERQRDIRAKRIAKGIAWMAMGLCAVAVFWWPGKWAMTYAMKNWPKLEPILGLLPLGISVVLLLLLGKVPEFNVRIWLEAKLYEVIRGVQYDSLDALNTASDGADGPAESHNGR